MPRLNLILPALIIAVALPATSAYTYFLTTRDPTLRPLGITREELAATFGEGHVLDITVEVDWGQDAVFAESREALQRMLSRSLTAANAEHHFLLRDVPGDRVLITYVVGYNRFGPYHLTEAAAGINAAVAALKIELQTGQRP